MRFQYLRQRRVSGCAVVEVIAPENGPLSRHRLQAEFSDVCAEIAWDEELRAVVLSFEGSTLATLPPELEDPLLPSPSFVESVAELKLPVIAAIEGWASGPGLELALACDLRIGTEGSFYALPQVCSGWIPQDGGTQRLARFVGLTKALEMILLGDSLDAVEALRTGLLNRVVAEGETSSLALTLAEEIAGRSPLAVGYVKEALHKGLDLTLGQGIQLELDMYLHLFTTEDRTEGITAFRDKRTPEFKGR